MTDCPKCKQHPLPRGLVKNLGLCWTCAIPRDYWTPEFWAATRSSDDERAS